MYLSICMYVYLYVCTVCMYIYIYIYICIYVCMYVSIYPSIHLCISLHQQTHTHSFPARDLLIHGINKVHVSRAQWVRQATLAGIWNAAQGSMRLEPHLEQSPGSPPQAARFAPSGDMDSGVVLVMPDGFPCSLQTGVQSTGQMDLALICLSHGWPQICKHVGIDTDTSC